MHRIAAATLLATGLLVTGCSSSDDPADSKSSSNPTKAAETTAAAKGNPEYDKVWDSLNAEAQKTTCELMAADGPESVSYLLSKPGDTPSVDMKAAAEYINDEKC